MSPAGKKPKSSPKKPSTGKLRPEYLFAIALVLAAAFIVMKGRQKKFMAEEPIQQASEVQEAVQVLPEVESKSERAYTQADLERDRARQALKDFLGLRSMPLKGSADYLEVPFRFTPRKEWCKGGDLDTMKYASNDANADQVLITVEPLGTGKGDFLRTSVVRLYENFDHIFKLKPSDRTKSYGLYICSDSGNASSCKGKTLASHDAISVEAVNAKGDGQAKKKDYIFYFQHLLLDKQNLETYRTDEFSGEFKSALESYLKDQKQIDAAEIQNAWKTSNLTRSQPTDVKDGKIILALPYNDPRCSNPMGPTQ